VTPLALRNPKVARLRELLRDPRARAREHRCVAEGVRVVAAALDHGAVVEACFVGADASPAAHDVAMRAAAAGADRHVLADGVAARVAPTVASQGIFAVVRVDRSGLAALDGASLVVVGAPVGDPGNAGTLVRSAAAAGASAVALGAGSVDAYNPKVVRASAGACFAIPTVEGVPAVEILEALAATGVRRLAAVARGGAAPEAVDLTVPVAFVLGHETHGLDPALPVDGTVTVPMAVGESLNVAMAGTVLLFEAARQRRAA
jgi:TrmH family RNA methyltransferase